MKKYCILILIFGQFLFSEQLSICMAQPAKQKNKVKEDKREKKIRYIEDIYAYTRDKITQGLYYTDEYLINIDSLAWYNGENFQMAEYYHYSYLGQDPSLRLYAYKIQKGETMYYIEFLFDLDGTLLFCYQKQNLEKQYKYRELRAYFEKEIPVTLIINDLIVDYKEGEMGDKIRNILTEKEDCIRKFKEQGAVLHKY